MRWLYYWAGRKGRVPTRFLNGQLKERNIILYKLCHLIRSIAKKNRLSRSTKPLRYRASHKITIIKK